VCAHVRSHPVGFSRFGYCRPPCHGSAGSSQAYCPSADSSATCHKAIYDQWKASPHADNGIECTVCHGETTAKDFASVPALSTCDSCHSDQVAQLKSDPFMNGKTCVSCHQAHTFAEHKKAAPAGK
jgi:hypothetical protein